MMSATLNVRDHAGGVIACRALLDTCATAHFITEELARKLKLKIRPCTLVIDAIDGMNTSAKGIVETSIFSIHSDFQRVLSFLIVPKIADYIPNEVFPRGKINIPANLKLADPDFHKPRPVDMLIGSGTTLSLLSIGQINLSSENCDLYMQKTQLCWVIVGGVNSTERKPIISCKLTDLSQQIARFWLIEDATASGLKNSENVDCENHYVKNTFRNNSGRYVVRLPFRTSDRDFGDSRSIARRRFQSLRKKLEHDPILRVEYERVMNEYIALGHMSILRNETPGGYYMPHHALIKTSSATTKVRVVFDASAKSTIGKSLNDNLLVGPTIQDKLFEHISKFRVHRYVITADIEKMYRQILIHPDDRQFQRLFWLHHDEIRAFQLNTVTFGVYSAPFLAIRTIHKLADDEAANFPIGARILKHEFYVDDLLTGADTISEILEIKNQVIAILNRGGFNIRQWASNCPRTLEHLNIRHGDVDFFTAEDSISKRSVFHGTRKEINSYLPFIRLNLIAKSQSARFYPRYLKFLIRLGSWDRSF